MNGAVMDSAERHGEFVADLDAPDLAAPTGQAPGTKETKTANQNGRMNGGGPAVSHTPGRRGRTQPLPAKASLEPGKSAALADQLLTELASLMFPGIFGRTRGAHLEHENAKAELKSLMPEDAKEAIGHGVRAKRSKSGAVSFDLLSAEAGHASVQ
jgi:hypothetical protein